jgi:hypothetical protein
MEILANRKNIFNQLLNRACAAKYNYGDFSLFSGIIANFIEINRIKKKKLFIWAELEIINATLFEEMENKKKQNINIDLDILFQDHLHEIIPLIDEYIIMMHKAEWIDLNIPVLEWDLLAKVLLVKDLSDRLKAGTQGIIIDIHRDDNGISYEVEFMEDGKVLAQLALTADYLSKIEE